MSLTTPVKMPVPFCNEGLKNTIPIEQMTTPGNTNRASFNAGFPQVTMLNEEAGGIAPEGMDFNGILYALSSNIQNWNAGVCMKFDPEFAAQIGGYPKGAILLSDDETQAFISLVAENTVNFNTEDYNGKWAVWNQSGNKAQDFFANAAGTVNAITAQYDGLEELIDGMTVSFRATGANTITTPTFNPSELGFKTIVKGLNQPLAVGDIAGEGFIARLQYSATWDKWILQNPSLSALSSMPIGSMYVQFKGQETPNRLFGGTWSNVSNEYAGRFFRAEGGAAAGFGAVQEGGVPNVTGAFKPFVEVNSTATGAFQVTLGLIPNFKGGPARIQQSTLNFQLSKGNPIYGATEVRPINSTIRIWKRTA